LRAPACLLLICTASLLAQTDTIHKSPTTEDLRGLSAPSADIFWASGTHGTYLRSIDGGKSWRAAQVPGAEGLDLRDVEAFSADLAYLLSAGPGNQSRIYKTADGGKSWTLQFTNAEPKGFFDCMAFWDRDHGVAAGDPVNGRFELITTADGGKNWKAVSHGSLPSALEGEGAFAASGTCITVQGTTNVWFATGGRVARVFRSTDAGKTWTVADTPMVHGADSSGIFSIAFRDAKRGVIAGGDYKQPQADGANLAFTEDGGLTWHLAPLSPKFYVSAIAWERATSPSRSDSSAVFAVGSARAAYVKNFDDRSWTKTWDLKLNSVACYAPGKFIAVGPGGLTVLFGVVP